MKKYHALILAVLSFIAGYLLASSSSHADSSVTARMFDVNGAEQTGYHMVIGSSALVLGAKTMTLSGAAVFTSSSSYKCVATESTGLNLMAVTYSSGSSFTVLGVGTDTIGWVCFGN